MPSPLEQAGIVFLGLCLLPLIMKLLCKLRLLPLAIYVFITELVFVQWSESHQMLSLGILIALAILTAGSWVITLCRNIVESKRLKHEFISRATVVNDFWDGQ